MAKIDLDSLGIEELASLRDSATEKLYEKVAARQAPAVSVGLLARRRSRLIGPGPSVLERARRRQGADPTPAALSPAAPARGALPLR